MVRDANDINSTAEMKPARYQGENGIECIDVIKAALGNEGFENYCIGTAVKYLFRYRKKNGLNDLEKCRDYLEWAMEACAEREKAGYTVGNLEKNHDK